MNKRTLAVVAAILTVVFLVLNFTMDAGTLYLILAVVSGLLTVYLATKRD